MKRAFSIFTLMLWLILQGAALAHSVEHDADPQHDTEHCVLCHVGDRQDDPVIPPDLVELCRLPATEQPVFAFQAESLLEPTYWFAPPGRAPPLA